MFKRMKRKTIITSILLLVALVLPQGGVAFSGNETLTLETLNKLPKDSVERYAYSKAMETGTSYQDQLEIEKNTIVPLAVDEYVTYKTESKKAGVIDTNIGKLYPVISSEAKVVVNRVTRRVTRVINFGYPYASVKNQGATWQGGGFNVDRKSDTSARFSSTGQFFIDNGSLSVGLDIISYSVNLGAKTKVMTIRCIMDWN